MNFIDLSHSISSKMSTYPTDPDIKINVEKNISDNGSLLHSFKMGTHTGTHLDAPAHVIPNGKKVDEFNLKNFTGTTVKVDKSCWRSIDSISDELDGIIYDSVWHKNFNNSAIFYSKKRPIIPSELVQFAVEKQVKFFGTDLPSVDASGSTEKPIHHSLLGNDIIIYETLANLDMIANLKKFTFYGFPLSFSKFDGSPVRAVAKIDSNEDL
tara:strand:+ start:3113 stop:3745 length:633 start_codon:yes stop_codon:yes gene_type:complete